MRHRCQLVRRRKDVKLRIRGLLRENRVERPTVNAWTKPWLAWLTDEASLTVSDRWIVEDHVAEIVSLTSRIQTVERQIRQTLQDDPLVARLMTLPGVGPVTAATLRAEVGRFDRFDTGKQLARFCGVTPRNISSGARQADAGPIRAGNPELRHGPCGVGPSTDSRPRSALGEAGPWHAQPGQAKECRHRGGGQSLGPLAPSRTTARAHNSAQARQKGAARSVSTIASTSPG